MNFQEVNSYLAPIGLIIAGIIMRVSNNTEVFGAFKKRWGIFIIMGLVLLLLKIFA
ncbi:MAG: hypothetical protein RRY99_09825 [Flavobacterium sp.]